MGPGHLGHNSTPMLSERLISFSVVLVAVSLCAILCGGDDVPWRSLGCYEDTEDHAVPSLEKQSSFLDIPYHTRPDAINKCYKAALKNGFRCFVIQNGGWCGGGTHACHTYAKYGYSGECGADGKGGPLANNVYEITVKGDDSQEKDKEEKEMKKKLLSLIGIPVGLTFSLLFCWLRRTGGRCKKPREAPVEETEEPESTVYTRRTPPRSVRSEPWAQLYLDHKRNHPNAGPSPMFDEFMKRQFGYNRAEGCFGGTNQNPHSADDSPSAPPAQASQDTGRRSQDEEPPPSYDSVAKACGTTYV